MPFEQPAVAVPVGRSSVNPAASGVESAAPEPLAPPKPTEALIPLIDIFEEPEGLVLEADLPGVLESNLTIHLEDNVLNLRGRVVSPLPEGARSIHEEYRPGDFGRSFILSDEVDRTRVAATFRNGVLRITLPRAERVRTRKIEIRSS